MFAGWMIMLALGNLGHLLPNPKLFVSYWFCVPFGILVDLMFVRGWK